MKGVVKIARFRNQKYYNYLRSDKWQEKRKAVFERALKNANCNNLHGICERCGYKPWKPILQVHHLTYERLYDEDLSDLMLVCPRCHRELTEEARMKKLEAEMQEKDMKN